MTATSPLEALRPYLGDATKGQVVVVLATAGLGKTALLVHAALDAMRAGRRVLHVDVAHTVAHVHSRYDGVCQGLGVAGDPRRAAERNRMVHSVLGQPFEVGLVANHLLLLENHASFRAELIVVDGLDHDTVVETIDDLVALAAEKSVPLWVTLKLNNHIPDGVRAAGTVGVRLRAHGTEVGLSILRKGVETALPVRLRSGTLVVADDSPPTPVISTEVTLFSGGAQGTEACFGELAAARGLTEVNFTFPGHKQARIEGSRPLTSRELASGDVSMVFVSRRLNRTYSTEGTLMRGILQTLWHMVSSSRQVFVVGVIQPDGTVVGGTGWSVELARMWNKDLWVYCQERRGWHHWEMHDWVAGTPKITAQTICGTGTRKLADDGRQALQELFSSSFA